VRKEALSIDVIRCCRKEEAAAMEAVYSHYKSALYNLVFRFSGNHASADDLLQDIFVTVFTNIKKLHSLEAFHSWLYRIAINTCLNFSRRVKNVIHVPIDGMEEIFSTDHTDCAGNLDIKQAIHMLPPKQKIILILHDVQGLTHVEIAGYMRLSKGTCKSQLLKARLKLREYLGV
jgi:RNA polymerase sigma-70 factor (ECF subfamily)